MDAIATSPNQISRNCYFMHICMQNMQNLKYHALSKILQKTSKYCATSYGMIAIELLKNSKISLQKTIDINDAKLYINGLNQTLQDEIEFTSYLIKCKKKPCRRFSNSTI